MSGVPADHETDQDPSQQLFRALTFASSLAVAGSYALPWVDVVGPAIQSDATAGEALIGLEENSGGGTIAARDIAALPEVTVGFALLVVVVVVLRWNVIGQIISGTLGLVASGVVLFLWAFITTDGEGGIELGGQAGPAASFDPAVGLWIALFGSIAILVCGFGAAVREYVRRQEAE